MCIALAVEHRGGSPSTGGMTMKWPTTAVLLGALLAVGTACQDASRLTEVSGPTLQASLTASSSSLPHIANTSLAIPASISVDLSTYDCSNHPGPQITFSGVTVLGGFGVELLFSNNVKGTHQYTVDNTVQLTEVPAGTEIVIPKQPVLGGVGGNPFIWVQFLNGDGTAASGEIFVGRCVQGADWHVTGPTSTLASASARYTVESCSNSPGPFIHYEGDLSFSGLTARVIFRNNDNPVGGPHTAEAPLTSDIVLIKPGLSYTFPKQPVLGGVGGNPWIFAGFTDGSGAPLGDATLLGRCVQLSQLLG